MCVVDELLSSLTSAHGLRACEACTVISYPDFDSLYEGTDFDALT